MTRAESSKKYYEKVKNNPDFKIKALKRANAYRLKVKDTPEYRAKRVIMVQKYLDVKRFGLPRAEVIAEECATCNNTENLIIHHINGEGRGLAEPDNRVENLVTLCRRCHYKIHHKPELLDFNAVRTEELLIGLGYII